MIPIRLSACVFLAALAAKDLYGPAWAELAVDARGTIYVGDTANGRIYRIGPDGRPVPLPRDLGKPYALAVSPAGELHVGDWSAHAVRKLGGDGKVRLVAGKPGPYAGCVDGPRERGRIGNGSAIAFDPDGRLWIAEGQCIRRVAADGALTTVFGVTDGEDSPSIDGPPAVARCQYAKALAFAPDGALWFVDAERVRRMGTDGVVATIAGAMGEPARAHADGRGSEAFFADPLGIAVDRHGVAFVADSLNGAIRRVTADGWVTTFAGDRRGLEQAARDGSGYAARFGMPGALAFGPTGDLFVAGGFQPTVRRVSRTAVVTTFHGTPAPEPPSRLAPVADGPPGTGTFGRPTGVAADGRGGAWVVDEDWHAIRHVGADGRLTTKAGNLATLDAGHRDGPVALARLHAPHAAAVGPDGALYFADQHTIRRLGPDGQVSTVAGDLAAHQRGARDGSGAQAAFNGPAALAFDGRGGLLVADTYNHAIRRIDLAAPGRPVVTIAGKLRERGDQEGRGDAARFREPRGLALLPGGVVAVCDAGNRRVRLLAPDGTTTALAGQAAGPREARDGQGVDASFETPGALAPAPGGGVWVAEPKPGLIRLVAPDGRVTTVVEAGTLKDPQGLAPDGAGGLWVTDAGNRALRRVAADGSVRVFAGSLAAPL